MKSLFRYSWFACFLLLGVFAFGQTAEEYKKSAVEKADVKNYAGAIADFTQAIELSPADTGAYFDRAMVREFAGDLTGAVEDYSTAAQMDSTGADNFYLRGLVWEKLHNYSSAIADYKKTLSLEPDNADAEFHWGNCLINLGQKDEALKRIEKAIELNPDQSEAHAERAMMNIGNKKAALDDLQHALAKDPQLTTLYFYLAKYYLHYQNYKEVIVSLSKLAERQTTEQFILPVEKKQRSELNKYIEQFFKGDAGENYFNSGKVWMMVENHKSAFDAFKRAIEINRSNAGVFFQAGLCAEYLHKNKISLTYFLQALKINPVFTEALTHAAKLEYEMKNAVGAISDISKAISTQPYNATLYLQRGKYLLGSSANKKGCDDIETAKKLGILYLIPDITLPCK